MSQARNVMPLATVPFRSPKGSSRMRAVGPSSNASSLVLLLRAGASTVSQPVPPSRLYCQVPRLVSSAVIAMASTAPSASVMLPSTTSAATVTPAGLVAPSATLPSVGLAAVFSTGASLTAPMFTVLVAEADALPSDTSVVRVRAVVLSGAVV